MIRGKEKFLSQLYAGADFIVIQIAFLIAWFVRFLLFDKNVDGYLPFETYLFWSFIYGVVFVGMAFILSLYIPKRKSKFAYELTSLLQVHVFSGFVLLSILFTVKIVDISRVFLLVYIGTSLIMTFIYRYIVKQSLRQLRKNGHNKQFVLIVGAGALGRKYYQTLRQQPEFGLEVLGFLDDYHKEHADEYKQYKPIIGKVDDLSNILIHKLVDEVIIALPMKAYPKYRAIILACEKAGIRVSIIPDFYDILPAAPYFESFGDLPIINVRDVPLDEVGNKLQKRLFDIVFSGCVILLLSPILLAIAIGNKVTSSGPIIFKQERVGLNRRKFYMYKFRSMKHMPQSASDTQWTTENDPRRTKFGTFLRKTSLDELPQFFNVLFGDMSVVGPRPERPFFVDQFKEEIPKYMVKHHVRPGITGWAQVCGLRGDTSIKKRIDHDLFYIENWTILFDIKIILKTVVNGFVNRNAY